MNRTTMVQRCVAVLTSGDVENEGRRLALIRQADGRWRLAYEVYTQNEDLQGWNIFDWLTADDGGGPAEWLSSGLDHAAQFAGALRQSVLDQVGADQYERLPIVLHDQPV